MFLNLNIKLNDSSGSSKQPCVIELLVYHIQSKTFLPTLKLVDHNVPVRLFEEIIFVIPLHVAALVS